MTYMTIAAQKAYQTFIVQSQFDEVRSRKICPHVSVFTSPLPVFVFLPPYLTGLVLISLFSLVNLSLRRSLSVSQFVCYRPHVSPVLLSVTEPLPNQLRHIISQECRTPGKKTSKERLHTSLKTARMLSEDHRQMKLTEPHHLRRTEKKRHVTIGTNM